MQRLDLTQLPVVAGSRHAPNTPLGYRVAKRTDASVEFLLEGTDLLNDKVTYSDVDLKVKTAIQVQPSLTMTAHPFREQIND